ncbi:hypothetical protein BgAZ_304410 [Babesia gibsoni]|uniref:EF-hand domain-containing protein n=1 Tax=Babesia gibsoni TaxID=33632 RepID=A0AAD8PD42_BABGI|nr:hypothetical protein BgAZ_304410 [Babesia gibsoni]
MAPMLRPLKTQQLLAVFKVLDREKRGRLGLEDLDRIFSEILGINLSVEELRYTMKHLISLGSVVKENASPGHDTGSNTMELDFSTFIDAVNSTIKQRPVEEILEGTFSMLTGDKDRITVDDMLDLSKKVGIDSGSDARVRIVTRMPNESADFAEFCQCISGT